MSNQQEQPNRSTHPQLPDPTEQSSPTNADDDELMRRLGEWSEQVRKHLARIRGEGRS